MSSSSEKTRASDFDEITVADLDDLIDRCETAAGEDVEAELERVTGEIAESLQRPNRFGDSFGTVPAAQVAKKLIADYLKCGGTVSDLARLSYKDLNLMDALQHPFLVNDLVSEGEIEIGPNGEMVVGPKSVVTYYA